MPLPWEQSSSKTIIDTMGALVVFLDRLGRIVEFNHACEQLTGYVKTEAMGQVLWDFLLLPEERGPVQAVFERLRAGDFPNQFENHWVTKAGAARLITWSNTVLLDTHGQVEIIVGTGIDITERRRAEDALHTSEARYRALMEQAAEGIFIADPTGRYVDVNPSACQMLGYSRSELLQLRMQDVVPPEEQARLPLRMDDLLAGKTLTLERYLRRKDGTTMAGEISAKMLDDGRLLGIVRDISERKRTDEALRRRDAILEAVAFAAEEFLKTADWEHSIQDVLARLAVAVNATHAYLIQITGDQTATPQTTVRSVWTALDSTPVDISELNAEHFVSLEPWRDLLIQGQSIHGLVKDLPAFRQTPLWPSFKTVAIVPVFLEGEIWGVMGFGHSDLEHEWQVPEVDACARQPARLAQLYSDGKMKSSARRKNVS